MKLCRLKEGTGEPVPELVWLPETEEDPVGVARIEYVRSAVAEWLGDSVLAEVADPLEERERSGLPVAPEGEFWGLELADTVPLRQSLLVDEPLPDTEAFCVEERDTTALLLVVGAPELVFDTEGDGVAVVDPVLVRDPVCDSVAVVVPEEDKETEALSDHSALIEGWADPV